MKTLRHLLVMFVVCASLVLTAALAPVARAAGDLPGLQFAVDPRTGEMLQFQSGPILEGQTTIVSYDSLRLASPINPDCPPYKYLEGVKGYVMSDNSGRPEPFQLSGSYLKFGKFTTPACLEGSDTIQIWFVGDSGGDKCYDTNFSRNYVFPVICKK